MCGRATLAMEVSNTSMKAAKATDAAMIQGLTAGFHSPAAAACDEPKDPKDSSAERAPEAGLVEVVSGTGCIDNLPAREEARPPLRRGSRTLSFRDPRV